LATKKRVTSGPNNKEKQKAGRTHIPARTSPGGARIERGRGLKRKKKHWTALQIHLLGVFVEGGGAVKHSGGGPLPPVKNTRI